ncbi:MAG: hypothetical protein JRG94_03210 [Deltaproteobacteria bacterium]|nr:hypothetical protein [Deltaproteobacteria bacterium]MBW2724308.1 hypothetical protein [Deltaproteobacteria bacterium]
MREWECVELLREYVVVDRKLRSVFDRFQQGSPCFDEVALLVGDSDNSILFRLKERCHALFRKDPSATSAIHREVLFDLTVGSLFHEAMKLRENLYQQEVYVPKVEQLLEEHGRDDAEFFPDFEKIQAAGAGRTLDALRETKALLAETRKQLRAMLEAHSDNALLTRNLVGNREAVEFVFEADLAEILAGIHGDAAAGFRAAAHSYLESAFFGDAIVCLDAARSEVRKDVDADATVNEQLARLRNYAEGMQHFAAGAYTKSLESLKEWLDAKPSSEEDRYLHFAESALSRIGKLVNEESAPELLSRADSLVGRIQAERAAVAPGS